MYKTYSDIILALDGDPEWECVLYYTDLFEIWRDPDGKFWYLESSLEGDADEFFEVEIVARMEYSIENDIARGKDIYLHELFESDCCGETDVLDDGRIFYYWFKQKEVA